MRYAAFAASVSLIVVAGAACAQDGQQSMCDKLLSPSEISKATGLTVGKGRQGPKIAGSNRSCVWSASDGTRIIVVLSNAQQMQTTMDSMAQTGGAMYSGLGMGAVGTNGIPETGGGYNLSVVDPKGGVGITIPGSAGTSDRTVALAKVIEKHRAAPPAAEEQAGQSKQ